MCSRPVVIAALLVLSLPPQSHALFHLSQIDEAMSGVGGDPNTQYVQIRMLSAAQNFVANGRLTFFSCSAGNPATVLKLLDKNVPVGMADGHWIAATTDPVGGIHPDFTIPPGIDHTCGMICWGAPVDPLTLKPPADPASWSATDPANYIDCWAYGGYTGPTKAGGTETSAGPAGDGTMSLARMGASIALACPRPTNDAGNMGTFGACGTSTSTTLPGGAAPCSEVQGAASTRAVMAAECPCASAPSHRAYVKCAAGVVSKAVKAGTLPKSCKSTVKRCALHSTCGRPGFVTCCRTTAKGAQKCAVKKGAAACKAPKGGTACVSSQASCCDACGDATCQPSATTTTTPLRRTTTTTHMSGGNPPTTTTSTTVSTCVARGGSCAMNSQCCSRYCYLGQCY